MQAPPDYSEASPKCSKNDLPPVYVLDVNSLETSPWDREFPPSYFDLESNRSESCDTEDDLSQRVYQPRSLCWCFVSTLILMLLVLPLLCFLLYIFRDSLRYDPSQFTL
ncbi:unnamed protein product [Caenorhabditis angaria]|uniref:Uncharacterized protein n=1 Tax=Caenorhabditis angaria TaxID=860376 RepID=A0A9P1IU23_9PELO|nr:unnamed protein product [Caenorhabditis angaria]